MKLLPSSTAEVAPLVGAWIEISRTTITTVLVLSLLSWERGLKCLTDCTFFVHQKSLLSWERGLKYRAIKEYGKDNFVAPLVGAWIEIND